MSSFFGNDNLGGLPVFFCGLRCPLILLFLCGREFLLLLFAGLERERMGDGDLTLGRRSELEEEVASLLVGIAVIDITG